MSEDRTVQRLDPRSPWVLDTYELARRPGLSRAIQRTMYLDAPLGVPDVVAIPLGAEIRVELLLESVVEGILVSGPLTAEATAQCVRCLDPLIIPLQAELTELAAYPDSLTEATTDKDEIIRLVDDYIDLEPMIRDALTLSLPFRPLCSRDCPGLCSECGLKRVDLEPGHRHETIDSRWAALVERFGDAPANGQDQT